MPEAFDVRFNTVMARSANVRLHSSDSERGSVAFQNLVFLEAPGGAVSILQNQWLRVTTEGRFLESRGDECNRDFSTAIMGGEDSAPMSKTIDVQLTLSCNEPNSMNFEDTYSGLADIWYKFEADSTGNVTLFANADGFEHLARYFLKMARTGKRDGYHAHHTLEFGRLPEGPELTIAFVNEPR